jgi:hypothetical protein
MEQAKYTPGPWCRATDMGQVGSIEFADGTVIAQAQQLPGDPFHAQRNANARLIAAAPEMLEALILLEAEMVLSGNAESRDYGWKPAIEQTRAAILKATGEKL